MRVRLLPKFAALALCLTIGITFGLPCQAAPSLRDWYDIGVKKHKAGDESGAVQVFSKILKRYPGDVHTWRYRAATYIAQGKVDLAISDLERAIALGPDDAWTYNCYGNMLERRSQFEGAVSAYKKAIALGGDTFEYYYDLAGTLIYLGRFEEGRLWSQRAIEKHPQNAELHVLLAQSLFALDKTEPAWNEIEKASNMGSYTSYMYDVRSRILEQKGDVTAAIACLRAGVAEHPRVSWLHSRLSRLLLAGGDTPGAIKETELAIKLNPAEGATEACRIFEYDDKERALGYAEKAILLNPYSAMPYLVRGKLRSATDIKAAFSDFDMAIKLEPCNHLPHQYKAVELDRMRRYDEALVEYRLDDRLDTDAYFPCSNIGAILLFRGDYAEAEKYLSRAIDKGTNNSKRSMSFVYLFLGEAKYFQGRYTEAARDLHISYGK